MAGQDRKSSGSALRDFVAGEAGGGMLLIAAAAAALIVANLGGGASHAYFAALHLRLGPLSLQHWINDGLMAAFFLLVGLEIKREFVDGRLSTWERRRLPVIAAIAGMAVPAAIFLTVAGSAPALVRGWAIPSATDIAFAMGVLALLGSRAPASLKLFLATVAIVDDMGAVLIIAVGYSSGISGPALLAAGAIFALLFTLNRAGVKHLGVYVAGFLALWLAVMLSGVHATIAGVLAAMVVPIAKSPGRPDDAASPLHRLEHRLHPWVAYAIVPLFGFANAGVSLAGVGLRDLVAPLPLGIAAGLFIGKQIGVFGSIRLAVGLGIAARPARAGWAQVYGVALLCGIGFTMSLFIGDLAFADPALADQVKIGVLMGSFAAALTGYAVLRLTPVPTALR